MDNPVLIFGTGGLGRAALEIFESNGNIVYGFLDDDKSLLGTEIDNIPVLGRTDDNEFIKLIGKKCEAFVASDDNKLKKSLAKMLKEKRKVMPVNGFHSSASVAKSANLGHGNFFNGGSTVGAGVEIGNHCILHSGATVDHNCKLEDFVQIGAGASISANVEIGEGAFIGTGVSIIPGVKIGKNARIGAGSVVIADVEKGKTVFGNPATVVEK
ncbi:acetyltransferase [Reichenbachiella versicolor]|uniref:acetyltransferase n=1 Tax=Reichenbachiella versicolor TaxID=1821036 RepID=UPI000D6EA744|nr:acetyltransferase [Reichenbachiella versicolor]